MMNKTKSRKATILKYGLSVPILFLAMVLSSAKVSEGKIIGKLPEQLKSEKSLPQLLTKEIFRIQFNLTETQSENRLGKRSTVKTDLPKTPTEGFAKIRATQDSVPHNEIFTNVEILPSFPGGIQAFGKFLSKNLRYPKIAHDANIQGRVFCQFVVEKDGSLSNIKVAKGIGGGCDEEAMRVLSISPKWDPGIQNGRNVRVSFTMPILFQLTDGKVGTQVGNSTILVDKSAKNLPLVILNGLEYVGGIDKLKDAIKPTDIESLNVLKVEEATKKYGDKGKNGVVIITTKKK